MYIDKPANGQNATQNGQAKERKPVTVPHLLEMKQKGEKITMLTSYDASMTYQMEKAGVDTILVGDSLGMVVQGNFLCVFFDWFLLACDGENFLTKKWIFLLLFWLCLHWVRFYMTA